MRDRKACLFFMMRPLATFMSELCEDVEAALQIRAGQRSITANLRPLTAYIYHVMIIVTGEFSNKSFFLLTNLDLLSWNLNTFTEKQKSSLFSTYLFIFYLLFCNHSVY